jgi:hypothetical protein
MELHVNLIFRIIEKMYTITVELESLREAAHENAQRHRQLSCHG